MHCWIFSRLVQIRCCCHFIGATGFNFQIWRTLRKSLGQTLNIGQIDDYHGIWGRVYPLLLAFHLKMQRNDEQWNNNRHRWHGSWSQFLYAMISAIVLYWMLIIEFIISISPISLWTFRSLTTWCSILLIHLRFIEISNLIQSVNTQNIGHLFTSRRIFRILIVSHADKSRKPQTDSLPITHNPNGSLILWTQTQIRT